jgi:hypothetical protein
MDSISPTLLFTAIGVWVSSTIAMFTILVWIIGRIGATGDQLAAKISALADKEALDIGALRMEFSKDVERIQALEADARHRLTNETQRAVADLQGDLRRIRDTSASKDELENAESRLITSIGKIEIRVDRVDAKLEAIPAIQALLSQVAASIDKIILSLAPKRARSEPDA